MFRRNLLLAYRISGFAHNLIVLLNEKLKIMEFSFGEFWMSQNKIQPNLSSFRVFTNTLIHWLFSSNFDQNDQYFLISLQSLSNTNRNHILTICHFCHLPIFLYTKMGFLILFFMTVRPGGKRSDSNSFPWLRL